MKNFFVSFIVATFFLVTLTFTAFGQDDPETLVVTPVNTRGWSTADTRPGGTSSLVLTTGAPGGTGALKMTTDSSTSAKAQYMHAAETPLSEVTDLSYYAIQNSASFAGGTASYQLVLNLCGTSGFTTMVYEPYQNGGLVTGWQSYDVDAGQMWSSRTVNCGGAPSVIAGGGGPPFYTLAGLKADFPNAMVIGFGVNVGSNNPSYDISVDLVRFNLTTYDFEVYSTPATADDCKKGGWSTFNPPAGPFKNQGQCVSSVVTP